MRDIQDDQLVYICIEDRPRGELVVTRCGRAGELVVITLWEGGETRASRSGSPTRFAMPDVKLSNPDKVLFPDDGITKAELAEYYASVADVMVPHTRDRPMNLWRWNKGISEQVVVQQSLPKGAPDWVARCEVPRRKGGDITHGMINDADTLRWLSQQNCITPHVWNARCDRRDRPDRLVFDLDPTGDDFNEIREGALAVAEMLRGIGLTPFAKVSGSRGIHVVAPLKRTRPVDEVRAAAQTLADQVAAEHPDTLTTAWRKEKRDGRILVDVARNTYGQTIVAPYAVRALPGAPVSAPITWDEVADPGLGPQAFGLRAMRERVDDARRSLGRHRRRRRDAPGGAVRHVSEPLDERQLAEMAEGVGGEEVLEELLRLYREGLPRQLDRLRAAVKRGEAEEVRLAAHALRSGAAVLGASLLAETAAGLERLCERGDLAAAAAELERVAAVVAETDAALLARR